MVARLVNFVRHVRSISRLGATPAAALKVAVTTCFLLISRRLGRARWDPIALQIRIREWIGTCRVRDYADLEVLREILVDREYDLVGGDPRTILDLGSHIGVSILYFHARWPKARIVGVEPDPATFALLEENVSSLKGVEVVNVAVAGEDGTASFYRARDSWNSSLTPQGGHGTITVKTCTVPSLASRMGMSQIDLLKVDVEGAEEQVLGDIGGLEVNGIVAELHEDLMSGTPDAVFSCLEDFDITVGKQTVNRCTFVGSRRLSPPRL